MCVICKEALAVAKAGDPQKALRDIGHAILDGKDPDHFTAVEDKILGTEMSVDNDLDEAWERSRR